MTITGSMHCHHRTFKSQCFLLISISETIKSVQGREIKTKPGQVGQVQPLRVQLNDGEAIN